ncbi:MAG: S41 family peptidase [Acidobacteriota bacterium]
MFQKTKLVVLLVSTLIVLYGIVGALLPYAIPANEAYEGLNLFSAVLDHVRKDYVEEPDLRLALRGAIQGMVEALDPYAGFITAADYAALREPGAGDVGLTVSKRYGYVYVVAVLAGSPAEGAGLRTGDLIEAIDGQSTALMCAWEAQRRLRGEVGSPVKLKVIRSRRSEPQELELVRARLEPKEPRLEWLEEGIALVSLASLNEGAAETVSKLLEQAVREGAAGILLDLRNVATGELAEAVRLADALLPEGAKVLEIQGKGSRTEVFTSRRAPVIGETPLAVLVSGGTSGPAEVVAAALQDAGRATLVGERTDGRGVVLGEVSLADGSLLVVPTGVLVRPSGEKLGGTEVRRAGVTPDLEAPDRDFVSTFYFDHVDEATADAPSDEFYAELDAAVRKEQLRVAVSALREKIEESPQKSLQQAA